MFYPILIMKTVAIRNDLVTKLRERKNWSKQDLADAAGIHRQNIYNLEWGKSVSLAHLVLVADALDTPIADFIELRGPFCFS